MSHLPGRLRTLAKALKKGLLKPFGRRVVEQTARLYRSAMEVRGQPCFIGVTGSCGKTTTVDLLASVLAGVGPVHKLSHENVTQFVARAMMGVRLRHRFCVMEVSADAPGVLGRSVRLLQPHIGIVTNIGNDHYGSYRTLERTALEKSRLVKCLPARGTAVLNDDDPHVWPMRRHARGRVISYGFSVAAMVRGSNVTCEWPTPLSLDVSFAGETVHVQSRLFGEHWAHTLLAVLAGAIAAGVPLGQAAKALSAPAGPAGRMEEHRTADGVTFISDTWKAPLWTVTASLDFMSKARAPRKIGIFGMIHDTPRSNRDRYKRIIRQGGEVLDKMLFVGERAGPATRTTRARDLGVVAFATIGQLNEFLDGYLRPGDLVLLKGMNNEDHLHRIVLARTIGANCWLYNCQKRRWCKDCRWVCAGGPAAPASPGAHND